jgi:hypothetical protein
MRALGITLAILVFASVAVAVPGETTQPRAKLPKKIWTNDDVERLRPGWHAERPAEPAPAEQPAEGVESEAVAPPTAEPVPEAAEQKPEEKPAEPETPVAPSVPPKPPDQRQQLDHWQKELAPLRAELADVEGQISRIRQALTTGEGASNGVNLLDNSSRLSPENQIGLLEQRRAELLQKIAELEDDARRSSIPPGWLR